MEKLWRVLDANFNRAREGLRGMEEVARFVLDEGSLTAKLKQLRHRLREGERLLPIAYGELVAARESEGDVGAPGLQGAEGRRESWQDIAAANSKRAQEAVRMLEEFSKTVSAEAALIFKEIRFGLYTLEKELFSLLGPGAERALLVERFRRSRLYLVSGQQFALGRPIDQVVEEALAGGVDVVQLREKDWTVQELIEAGRRLRRLTREYGALFIVNDRVDVALAVDADGVHLGQDDLPVAVARSILGPGRLIGISTHSVEQALGAQRDGADYIGVGPVFPTQSKADVCAPVGLTLVEKVTPLVSIPFVAIGGIKEHNVDQVMAAGAQRVAVITAIVGAPDIKGAARELRAKIEAAALKAPDAPPQPGFGGETALG